MYNFNHDGSKFKLQISGEQYFVNEEKRTVTVVDNVWVAVPDYILRTLNDGQLPNGFVPAGFPVWWDDETIQMKHTAHCAPDDTWDEEKGRKIALAALEAKAYRSMAKRLAKWADKFNTFLIQVDNLIGEFMEKSKSAAEHDEKYIHDIA